MPAARPARRRSDGMVYGAGRDLDRTILTHLFVICPGHMGSTFLLKALATSQAVWSLPGEADLMPASTWPAPLKSPGMPRPSKFWAASQARIDRLTDPSGYDWPRNRKVWYFMARAATPKAPVFVAQAARMLLQVEMLMRFFRNARFLFMVRNPYAAGEGICRTYREKYGGDPARTSCWQGRSLEEWTAMHLVNCLTRQRRNVEAHGDRGVFFPYEAMYAEPERVAHEIRTLVPELGDLTLRQRLPVKGYDEMLTDMNARQIARLTAGQVAAFNRVFHAHRDLFDHFGYEMLDAGAFRSEGTRRP